MTFVFSVIVGLFAFLTVIGPRVLQPSNIAWLSEGDPATHYLGWLFFRNSEWSFPVGLNPTYGLEISNAIVFSDSNPLFAIIFKPFSPFFPDTFQYFGVWLLTCFVLQAWFAFKLVGLITKNPFVIATAASFFVFAPPMLWRLHGHLSLVGHFLVLASLYLTLNPLPKRRSIGWTFLLAVSALTHAYLLLMVGLVWAADLLGRFLRKSISLKNASFDFSIGFGVTLFACWQAGYFSVGDGTSSGGFGIYRMNLLSIFDPSGWSYVLSDIPEAEGDYEGFNYLGIGMIFLGVCALPVFLSKMNGVAFSIKRWPILVAAMLGLTMFALSNRLGIASNEFGFELPDGLMRIANIFRASGRMFWPAFYLIYFIIISMIVRGFSKPIAIALLGIGLAIQIADTSKAWFSIRSKLMAKPSSTWKTQMMDPFWREAAIKYRKVRWLTSGGHPASWVTLASYAGTHAMATDAVYLARVGTLELQAAQEKVRGVLQYGKFDADSLYVFDDSYLDQLAKNIDSQRDLLAKIDGFNVIAPGWTVIPPKNQKSQK